MKKVSHSNNILRVLQLFLIVFPYFTIILINILNANFSIFFSIGFIFFTFIYILIVYFTMKIFMFDWDLYRKGDQIILKNIFGNKKKYDLKLISKLEIEEIFISGISFYFKVTIDHDSIYIRFFPKEKKYLFSNYLDLKSVKKKLQDELGYGAPPQLPRE